MNAQCPHKWRSTLQKMWTHIVLLYGLYCTVIGSSSDSSLPPMGVLVCMACESLGKAKLQSAHFDGKQSRDPVDLPSIWHPSPSLTTFAFRSWEVGRLLLDLDSHGCTDPLGMFPLFLKRTADILAPRLAVVFRRLLRLGSLPVCWTAATVTPNPKGPPSSSVTNYTSISLQTNYKSTVQDIWASGVGSSWAVYGMQKCASNHPQFADRNGLGTCDAFCVGHTPYRVLWRWGRRREWFKSTSVQLLTGPTIRGFSWSSALWELEVLCCLFWHSFSLIGHNMSWWGNWLMWYQECLRDMFWVRSCPSCTPRSFSP